LTSVIAGWWLTLILYNRAVSGVAARGARQRAVARAEVAARAVARAEVAATAMVVVVASGERSQRLLVAAREEAHRRSRRKRGRWWRRGRTWRRGRWRPGAVAARAVAARAAARAVARAEVAATVVVVASEEPAAPGGE